MTGEKKKIPQVWPGMALSALALGFSVKALLDLSTAGSITGDLFPEYFLIPAFLCWPIFIFNFVRFANSHSTEKLSMPKAMTWAIFAGPLGFWLAGPCLSTVAHLLASVVLEISSQSADWDRIVNSSGVFVLIGLVLLIYVGTAAASTVSTWRITGHVSRIAQKNSGSQISGAFYKFMMATAITIPGFWLVLNTVGSYRGFVIFLVLQSLGYLLSFYCFGRLAKAIAAGPPHPPYQDLSSSKAVSNSSSPQPAIESRQEGEDAGAVISTKIEEPEPLLRSEPNQESK